ncbi:MAG: hypothetical protein ABSD20_07950 [Terriglobales bacterium]|jgi:hypothetical protein
MDVKEQAWLLKLIQNPPSGSKLEAARNWGVDLTLYIRTLEMTPEERAENMIAARDFALELRHSRSARKR